VAEAQPWSTSRFRLYRLGGWVAVLLALEEIDYLGVVSSVVRSAGIEGARIGRAYVGSFHDTLNAAAQYGLAWLPLLMLGIGGIAAAWWITRGDACAAWEILSWRFVPALLGVVLMIVAQFNDVHGDYVAGLFDSSLLNDFLEEPLELLAILCLHHTLVLELSRRSR
jgi:hypothetical protein